MLKLASKAESRVILLIDANLQRHGSATNALAGDGYPSHLATSRNAALTVLGETPAAAAVVLYPGRFDGTGFELIAALRRLRRTVPIAVVLGGSRSTASAAPRVLWFAVTSLDDRLRDAILRAIGVDAAGHRRDARETLPVAEPESAFEVAFGAGFEPDSEVTRPGVLRRGPSLRELEPFQISALARSAR
jgi:CheY-like chemotaxis protein